MNFLLSLRVSLRALARNKMRTVLSILGIVIGVGAVVAMVSIGQGATWSIQNQIGKMGNNLLFLEPGSAMSGGAHGGFGSVQTLTAADSDAIAAECPSVRSSAPLVWSRGQVVYGNVNWSTSVRGTTPDFPDVRNWAMADGGFFTESDVRYANKTCVLGKAVADELFGGESPVGRTVRIQKVPFKVVGVLARKGQAAWGEDLDDVVMAPWTSVKLRLSGLGNKSINMILVAAASQADIPAAKEQITALLRQRHKLAPGADDDFRVGDVGEITSIFTQATRVMTLLLAAVASISLLVGGIGIMNIMLVSVKERTREIGVRMAVGARPRDVRRQFLTEAVALTSLGGMTGIGLGALASRGIAAVAGWPVLLSPASIGLAFVFSAAVGIFFGFYPARRASQLDPIESLRYE